MIKIKIYKFKKRLELYEDEKKQVFQIGIGKNFLGAKEKEGDKKTPEGKYIICYKNPNSKYHLSVALNYPNNIDAKKGLEKKRIKEEEYNSICKANNSEKIPLWNTALGGEIFIHGELEKNKWSWCVRMYNLDMDILYSKVDVGTEVLIYP